MAQISLTFPDGNAREYDAGVTPAEVAESISRSLSKKAISATVSLVPLPSGLSSAWALQNSMTSKASVP